MEDLTIQSHAHVEIPFWYYQLQHPEDHPFIFTGIIVIGIGLVVIIIFTLKQLISKKK